MGLNEYLMGVTGNKSMLPNSRPSDKVAITYIANFCRSFQIFLSVNAKLYGWGQSKAGVMIQKKTVFVLECLSLGTKNSIKIPISLEVGLLANAWWPMLPEVSQHCHKVANTYIEVSKLPIYQRWSQYKTKVMIQKKTILLLELGLQELCLNLHLGFTNTQSS